MPARKKAETPQQDDAGGQARFDALAKGWLTRPGVTRSTMMGFPCLRVDGDFFASVNREGSALVVKLSAARVGELIEAGEGEPFAPNGRRFKEWVAIPLALEASWEARVAEAHAFVSG